MKTLEIRDRIDVEKPIRPWHFAPGERSIYAQLANEHAVVAFDLTTNRVVKRLELPVKEGITTADSDFEAPHHGLALTRDGATLCLAGRESAPAGERLSFAGPNENQSKGPRHQRLG